MGLFDTLLGLFAGSRQAEQQAQALQAMADHITQQNTDTANMILQAIQHHAMQTNIIIAVVGAILLIAHILQGIKMGELQKEIRDLKYQQASLPDSGEVRPLRNRRFS